MYLKNRTDAQIRQSKNLKKKRKIISKKNRIRAEKLKKKELKKQQSALEVDAKEREKIVRVNKLSKSGDDTPTNSQSSNATGKKGSIFSQPKLGKKNPKVKARTKHAELAQGPK